MVFKKSANKILTLPIIVLVLIKDIFCGKSPKNFECTRNLAPSIFVPTKVVRWSSIYEY